MAGANWSTQSNQPTAQMYRVSIDNDFPFRLLGGQQDNSAVRIRSRSALGRAIGERDWEPTAGGESGHIVADPDNPESDHGLFVGPEGLDAALEEAGQMPLPPYIAARRPADDRDRADYQTLWAERTGAVAAPTAEQWQPPIEEEKKAVCEVIDQRFLSGSGTGMPREFEEECRQRARRLTTSRSLAPISSTRARRSCGGTLPSRSLPRTLM